MAANQKARYLGSTDKSVHDAGSVEIDGLVLERDADEPVEVNADQKKRLEDMTYHRFAFGADADKHDGGDS